MAALALRGAPMLATCSFRFHGERSHADSNLIGGGLAPLDAPRPSWLPKSNSKARGNTHEARRPRGRRTPPAAPSKPQLVRRCCWGEGGWSGQVRSGQARPGQAKPAHGRTSAFAGLAYPQRPAEGCDRAIASPVCAQAARGTQGCGLGLRTVVRARRCYVVVPSGSLRPAGARRLLIASPPRLRCCGASLLGGDMGGGGRVDSWLDRTAAATRADESPLARDGCWHGELAISST